MSLRSRVVRAVVCLASAVIAITSSGCGWGRRAALPEPAPRPAGSIADSGRIQWVRLDSGALIRARLEDRTEVIGSVLAPLELTPAIFTASDTSRLLIVCEVQSASCGSASGPSTRLLPLREIRRLDVRGKLTGLFGYGGFYSGALLGLLASDSDDTQGLLLVTAGFGGMALGSALGSRITGWVPVFPCYHGCATGRYPAR